MNWLGIMRCYNRHNFPILCIVCLISFFIISHGKRGFPAETPKSINAEIIEITPKGITFETDEKVFHEQVRVVRNGETIAVLLITEIKGTRIKAVFVEKYKEVDFEDKITREMDGNVPTSQELKPVPKTITKQDIKKETGQKKNPPRMVIQTGHTQVITTVSFSPGNRLIATGSKDHTIKIWDALAGKELYSIRGYKGDIHLVRFSPDGSLIAGLDGFGILKFWTVETGNLYKSINENVDTFTFNPKGNHVAISTRAMSIHDSSSLKFLDLSTGKLLRTIKDVSYSIASIAFSPRDNLFATLDWDCTVKLWNSSNGKSLGTLFREKNACFNLFGLGLFSSFELPSVEFSPNGSFLAVSIPVIGEPAYDMHVKLFDLYSRKLIATRKSDNFFFNADGSLIVFEAYENVSKIVEVSTGNVKQTMPWYTNGAFSPEGRLFAEFRSGGTVGEGVGAMSVGEIIIYDVKNLEKLYILGGKTQPVLSLAFGPYSNLLASSHCGAVNNIILWDINTGKPIGIKNMDHPHPPCPSSVSFDSYGRYIAIGSSKNRETSLWEFNNMGKMRTFNHALNSPSSVAFSKDARLLAIGGAGGLVIFDVSTGGEIFSKESCHECVVAFSPDEKYISGGGGHSDFGDYGTDIAQIWKVNTGEQIYKFKHSRRVSSVAFSPDSSILATGSWDYTAKLWNINNGTLLCTLDSGSLSFVNSVAFSTDGRIVATAHGDRGSGGNAVLDDSIRLWDVQSCKVLRTLKGHSGWVTSVSFTPDGQYLASGSYDGTIKLWNLKNNEKITLAITGDEWLIYTDDGYFDASPHGGELVAMVQGLTPFSVDQFALRNNRPDIILKRMGLGHKDLIAHFYAQYQKRLKKAGFIEEQLSSELHVPEAKILSAKQDGKFVDMNFKVSDSKYNLKKYNIYVNDVPLFGAYGKEIEGSVFMQTERIELTNGENKIEVTAINEKGAESYRALTYADYTGDKKGNLYFIGFGVSNFKNIAKPLKYADKDVRDMAKTFSEMTDKYDDVVIKTYLNEEVTVENIQKAKQLLNNTNVDDTVVLFFAGHGMYDHTQEATYYYLTYDADLNNLSQTAADFDLVEDLMQGIPPRKKLLLIDTCESGEIEDDESEKYFEIADSRGIIPRTTRSITVVSKNKGPKRSYLYQKDRFIYNDLSRRSGAIVFSSSKGGELSYENDNIQNGFFTEAIMEALNAPDADKNKDGIISIDELKDYVPALVSEMTKGLQHPTVDRDNIYMKFGFPAGK